jgi:hypothetical protein
VVQIERAEAPLWAEQLPDDWPDHGSAAPSFDHIPPPSGARRRRRSPRS